MFFQSENLTIIRPDPFKHPVPVEKTVIENRDLCLIVCNILPINVNDHSFSWGVMGFVVFSFIRCFTGSQDLTRFPAEPDKMPEHPLTRHRVKVGITAQRIVYDRAIKIILDPNPAGELVGIACVPGEHNF